MADPVRPLVVIAGLEALAAAVLSVLIGLGTAGSDLDVWIAVATVVMWVVIVGALVAGLVGPAPASGCGAHAVPAGAGLRAGGGMAAGRARTSRWTGRRASSWAIVAVAGLVLGLRPAVREALV